VRQKDGTAVERPSLPQSNYSVNNEKLSDRWDLEMKGPSDPVWFPTSFSVGDFGVAVECDDASLAEELRRRYRRFPARAAIHFTARIHLAGNVGPFALSDTALVFSEGLAHFDAPGYEGMIDDKSGRGWLMLSSARPVNDVDYFMRVASALLAFRFGGLLFHAAGIVRGGRGYAFFGYSGSGKTTVARLSSDAVVPNAVVPNAVVLNDDLLLLMPSSQGWVVHATPFWNPEQVSPAGVCSAPVAGLFRLVQDRQVYLEDMEPGQALAELIASAPVISADLSRLGDLLERGRQLAHAVPIHKLHFLPDASFWDVIEHTGEIERKGRPYAVPPGSGST